MISFLNPALLAFLGGVLLPLAIHLLTRDRIQRVDFPTLRFFAKRSQFLLKKKNLREMILLAMRMAACGLLALGFARPFLGKPVTAADGGLVAETARVVVADVSGSMARPDVAAALREKAAAAVGAHAEGLDQTALIAFAERPRILVPFTGRRAELEERLAELTPGHGGTDLAAALRKADELLSTVSARKKEIVLLSDLQQSGWRGYKGDWKLAAGVALTVQSLAPQDKDADNLALAGAECPVSLVKDREPRTLAARVANYSAAEQKDVAVSFTLNGKKLDTQKVTVPARGGAAVRFRHVFDSPGDNLGVLAIERQDTRGEDNAFYFNTRLIPRIQTLILNGRPSSSPREDAAFFVRMALAPTEDAPFLVKTATPAQATLGDVQAAAVVILADVPSLPAPLRAALGALLARGGGLLFLPGPEVRADVFNREFGELAPCKLRQVLTPERGKGDEGTPAVWAKLDQEHPIFEIFQRPHYGDFSTVEFHKYWEVTDSQLARVLARFDDGRPALVERAIGSGVSILMSSPPVDLKWTNLPMRAIFLPSLHQTVRYLAVRTERRAAYQVGERLPFPEGAQVKDPAGAAVKGPEFAAALPGFYALIGADGKEEFHYAVNRDFVESETATVTPEELVAALETPAVPGADEGGFGPLAQARDTLNLWWYVLSGLGILLVSELAVANTTPRH
jgi:hypothetical protein